MAMIIKLFLVFLSCHLMFLTLRTTLTIVTGEDVYKVILNRNTHIAILKILSPLIGAVTLSLVLSIVLTSF